MTLFTEFIVCAGLIFILFVCVATFSVVKTIERQLYCIIGLLNGQIPKGGENGSEEKKT